MARAALIQKIHGDAQLFGVLAVKPVNRAVAAVELAGEGEGNGVSDAGFTHMVAAGDEGDVVEVEAALGGEALEPADGQARDFHGADFFHRSLSSFLCDRNAGAEPRPEPAIALCYLICVHDIEAVIAVFHRCELHVFKAGARYQLNIRAL